ncbi:MAG: hypothetical protein ACPG8W_19685 [Candidatus Promineifilaceae bacterium]
MNTKDLYKLILIYDVDGKVIQEYFQFFMGQYLPAMQKMGWEMLEAWTVSYGDIPNRQIELVANGRDAIETLLDSEEWETLNDKLAEYGSEFEYKFVPYREGFHV